MTVPLSLIRSHTPTTLTKCYSLEDGELHKKTAAQMTAGEITRVQVDSAAQFAVVLQQLEHNQALCYGVTEHDSVKVYSRKEYERRGEPADAITRTKDHFSWSDGPGILFLDYDPDDSKALPHNELMAILTAVVPELDDSARVWWASSSSLIYNEQEQLAGIKGQRVYVLVADAADIPRAGEVLFKRLWLAGQGYYTVSRSGAALERTIVDNSVWQTNRLDFAAGARCTPPLEQRRGNPAVYDGGLLDTVHALPDLTPEEEAQIKAEKDKALAKVKDEIAVARQTYIEQVAARLVEHSGQESTPEALEQARRTVSRAAQQRVLTGDFVLTLADQTEVTVGEVLDNPSEYHGWQTLDPLEPEYDDYKVVGKLFLIGGRPNLYSFAHGGRNFRLIRQPRRIEHEQGDMAGTTRKTLDYLRNLPDVFDKGSALAHVRDGQARTMDIHELAFWLGGVAQYYRSTANGEKNIDPPPQTLNQLLAIGDGRHLRPLRAVVSAPVIDTDGRVLERVGYDAKTQLYLDMPAEPPPVPAFVGEDDVEAALETLMAPFRDFATATALDKGVLLAAILTAVQRFALPTAPAIGVDAPVQGTGKTYLSKCLCMLGTGAEPAAAPPTDTRNDEEVRKRLFAAALKGETVLFLDNIVGTFRSPATAALLTSPTITDRVLGKSEQLTVPSRMLLLFTGNNLTLAGDMPRRVLKCRLDAKLENPAARHFNHSPLDYIRRHRQELVQAALTIIRGYLQSVEYLFLGGAVPDESTASFEDWDTLVRQPVAWLTQRHADIEDPGEALKSAVAEDPEVEMLAELLKNIEAVMGNGGFKARQLCSVPATPGDDAQALQESLNDVLPGPITSRAVGIALRYRLGRIAGGRRLAKRGRGSKNAALYRVEQV